MPSPHGVFCESPHKTFIESPHGVRGCVLLSEPACYIIQAGRLFKISRGELIWAVQMPSDLVGERVVRLEYNVHGLYIWSAGGTSVGTRIKAHKLSEATGQSVASFSLIGGGGTQRSGLGALVANSTNIYMLGHQLTFDSSTVVVLDPDLNFIEERETYGFDFNNNYGPWSILRRVSFFTNVATRYFAVSSSGNLRTSNVELNLQTFELFNYRSPPNAFIAQFAKWDIGLLDAGNVDAVMIFLSGVDQSTPDMGHRSVSTATMPLYGASQFDWCSIGSVFINGTQQGLLQAREGTWIQNNLLWSVNVEPLLTVNQGGSISISTVIRTLTNNLIIYGSYYNTDGVTVQLFVAELSGVTGTPGSTTVDPGAAVVWELSLGKGDAFTVNSHGILAVPGNGHHRLLKY